MPPTHHQNGAVECKHKHIVELGLSLLSHESLPLTLWDHVFVTAIYLINCLPSTPTDLLMFILWSLEQRMG